MEENHVSDLLPDFVLGVLSDSEESMVSLHLQACQTCLAEFVRLQQVADDLPLALAQTTPPPRVKENLMRAISTGPVKQTEPARPSLWQSLVDSFRLHLPAYGLALILVLALGNILLWRQLNSSGSQSNTDMMIIGLVATSDAPGASGTLIMDHQGHYGTLVVEYLPVPDPGYQYQVWLGNNGERISAGLFDVNYEGYGSMELSAPDPLISYQSIGITLEPQGGSPGPTGAKVMGADLPQ
jgi:anti-sigma-K factor RskA